MLSKLEKRAGASTLREGPEGLYTIECTQFNNYSENFASASAMLRLRTGYNGPIAMGMPAREPLAHVQVLPIPAQGSSVRGVRIEYTLSPKPVEVKSEESQPQERKVGGPGPSSTTYDW